MFASIANTDFGNESGLRGTLHETIKSLQSSARQICYICSNIVSDLTDEYKLDCHTQDLSFAIPIQYHVSKVENENPPYLVIEISSADYNLEKMMWWYCLIAASKDPDAFGFRFHTTDGSLQALHPLHPVIPNSTGTPEVGTLARSWYKLCRTAHSQCIQVRETRSYPPRLLDLSSESPRLVIGANIPPGQQYAALSHCWGANTSFLRLTNDRLDEFLENGISLGDLPQNFRDAIQMCRWVDIRYLWIDSLCIIQQGANSEGDWNDHVKLMLYIYENCDLCIATAAAGSATENAFKSRNPNSITPIAIDSPPVNAPYESPEPHLLIEIDHDVRGHRNAPIASRAWVLQERLLSPRILTLGTQQLFWECSQTDGLHVCETFPLGLHGGWNHHAFRRGPFNLPRYGDSSSVNGILESLCEEQDKATNSLQAIRENWDTWRELIKTYSACQLTYPDEDKSAAFAGIAQHMTEVFNNAEYVVGFFHFELPAALLWLRIDESQSHQSRPSLYRAPSWSWVSTNSQVSPCYEIDDLSSPDVTYLASVQSHRAEYTEPGNTFGRVKDAEIVIRAPLTRLCWEPCMSLAEYRMLRFACKDTFRFPDFDHTLKIGKLDKEEEETEEEADTKEDKELVYRRNEIYFDYFEEYLAGDRGVYFVPILTQLYIHEATTSGLIIKRIRQSGEQDDEPGIGICERFIRIGVLEFTSLRVLEQLKLAGKRNVALV